MLSQQDNDAITKVGPGTLMGNLIREYWVPALISSELPGPDCDPVRVLLLGEPLEYAFRNSEGKVGLVANLCPHRSRPASFWGRNEESGIRCVYHGWKFDLSGACVDMPNEPPESNFKQRVRTTAYPCVERGGIVWTYMGPRATPPSLPDIEANQFPEGEYSMYAIQRECNWLQGLEGDIDTVHVGFLHGGASRIENARPDSFGYYGVRDHAPRYVALDTDYGAMYGAYRPAGDGELYWRIAQFLFPFWSQPPSGVLGDRIGSRAWVPMDDEHTMVFGLDDGKVWPGAALAAESSDPNAPPRHFPNGVDARWAPAEGGQNVKVLPNTDDWFGRFRYEQNYGNSYHIDRGAQRRMESYTGIPGSGTFAEDQAVTESMGPTLDRTAEHLGTSDIMVIHVRHRLLEAARMLAESGTVPPGVDDPEVYRVRSGGVILPEDVDWLDGIRDLLPAYVEHPDLDRSRA